MKRRFLYAAFFFVTSNAMATDPCLDNFSSDGNILTGRTYKTWALLPGLRQQQAFPRAHAFTAENGFTILSGNQEAGVISAAQSVSYGNGKNVPLTITFREESGGTRIAISYATSGGVFSPEDAIKRHFCLTVAAAAGGVKDVNAMETPQAVIAPSSTRVAPRGFAFATAEQQNAIGQELSKPLPNEKVRQMVKNAAPAIAVFVEHIACLADASGASALDEYAVPGGTLGNAYIMLRPMRSAQYHNKAACMTVSRIQGWNAPANNALRFEVVYKADDSGEVNKLTHEAIKQPDGAWRFSQ